ncbi:MAG: transporter [Leadbetterella sp.]
MPIKITLFFLFISYQIVAQSDEIIATDRPDQTECSDLVPVGYFQMENGFFQEKDKTMKTSETMFHTSLLKFGVTKRFELRLIVENSRYEIKNEGFRAKSTGLNPIQIGTKIGILKQKGIIPMTSLIAHVSVPKWASGSKKETYFAPNFRFTMQHDLNDDWTFSYNLGAEWDGITGIRSNIYTITTGYGFTDKLTSYIELYGFLTKNQDPDHRFDAGITYLLKPNILLDISGGVGITDISPDHFIGCGFSFRIPK